MALEEGHDLESLFRKQTSAQKVKKSTDRHFPNPIQIPSEATCLHQFFLLPQHSKIEVEVLEDKVRKHLERHDDQLSP